MSRRRFVKSLMGTVGLAGLADPAALQAAAAPAQSDWLPPYTRAQTYRSKKQSSHDPTGGNQDYWPIKSGEQREVFVAPAAGAGVISHIWFTIAAQSPLHLKELVLRAYWDGLTRPSVETPIGDFFGLNLGDYVIYESEYLACSPGQSLNCYFAIRIGGVRGSPSPMRGVATSARSTRTSIIWSWTPCRPMPSTSMRSTGRPRPTPPSTCRRARIRTAARITSSRKPGGAAM